MWCSRVGRLGRLRYIEILYRQGPGNDLGGGLVGGTWQIGLKIPYETKGFMPILFQH